MNREILATALRVSVINPNSAPDKFVIDVDSQKLYDVSGNAAVDWAARQLKDADGTTVVIEWDGGFISANSHLISNVLDPVSAQDVATKAYVDAASSGVFSDSTFRIQDNGDSTKRLAFEVSGITASTTRTITMTDADLNLSLGVGGSFANATLSNLGTTSVNANIVPNGASHDLGAASGNHWSSVYMERPKWNTSMGIYSDNFSTTVANIDAWQTSFATQSGPTVNVIGMAALSAQSANWMMRTTGGSSNSGHLFFETGNASGGTAGNIYLTTGTSAGTPGNVIIKTPAVLPSADNSQDLGSGSNRWNNLIVSHIKSGSGSGPRIDMATESIKDSGALESINWESRNLVANDGSTVMFNWSSAGVLNASSNLISNVLDPVSAQDAATKNYVDVAVSSIVPSAPALAAAAAFQGVNEPVAVANATIGGVTPANGDVIFLGFQTDNKQNGVYIYNGAGNPLTRKSDWSSDADFSQGRLVIVGAGFEKTTYYLKSAGVVGTDPILFDQEFRFLDNGSAIFSETHFEPGNSGAFDLGTSGQTWRNVWGQTFQSPASLKIITQANSGLTHLNMSATGITTPSGATSITNFVSNDDLALIANTDILRIETGNASGATPTQDIQLKTGTSVDGNSGAIRLTTGAATGTGTRERVYVVADSLDVGGAPIHKVSLLDDGSEVISVDVSGRTLNNSAGGAMLGYSTAGVLDMNSNLLSNVLDPVSAQDAATKAYVDAAANPDAVLGKSNLTVVGGVTYVASSGTITEDNANFHWDSTNKRLGIGTVTPLTGVHVVSSGASGSDHGFTQENISANAFGGSWVGKKARGSIGSPTAVLSQDVIVAMQGLGYGATGYSAAANGILRVRATENHSDSAHGTQIEFATVKSTTATVRNVAVFTNDAGFSLADNGTNVNFLTQYYAAGGTTYNITWPSSVAGQTGNVLVSDNTGVLSWNSTLTDTSSFASVDYLNRVLYASDGATQMLDYSNPGSINVNSNLITNVADPVSPGDAVNKSYADSISAGLDPKAAVQVATTANLAFTYATTPSNGQFSSVPTTGSLVIDGYTVLDGNRVLVKDQTDAKQNGIYIYDATGGFLTRSADMDGTPANDVAGGDFTFIQDGAQAGFGYVVIWNGNVTLNTDPVNWSQFAGGTNFAARDLSNLTTTSINQNLLPNAAGTLDIGASGNQWRRMYVDFIGDASGDLLIDTAGQRLYPAGASYTVNWGLAHLRDLSSNKSLDWTARQLIGTDGSSVKLDWASTQVKTHVDFIPNADNTQSIGNSGSAFANVWTYAIESDAALSISADGGELNLIAPSTNAVNIKGDGSNSASLRLFCGNLANHIGFKSPSTLAGSVDFVVPGADGTSGQVISTNGSGVLSFVDVVSSKDVNQPTWQKFTLTTSDLGVGIAATTNSITLFSLGAKQIIHGVIIKHSTAFSGGSATNYTLSVGITGNLEKYSSAFSVFQAVGCSVAQASDELAPEDFCTSTDVKITAVSTGDNLENVSAGVVDVWVALATLP